jgi:hypothetical protein
MGEIRATGEIACAHDMLVQIRWQGHKMIGSISQLAASNADESSDEACPFGKPA